MRIEVWSDVVCPWCYIGKRRLERALADFAAAMQRERSGVKVVGITGSNGKTSVKTLVMAILVRAGRAYANPGNRNNEIGLPLSVLDAPEDAQFAVYEISCSVLRRRFLHCGLRRGRVGRQGKLHHPRPA